MDMKNNILKLNNMMKKVEITLIAILVFAAVFVGSLTTVKAASAPSSLNMSRRIWSDAPFSTLEDFHVKYVTNTGEYVYCLTYSARTPNGVNYSLGSQITDAGEDYILAMGANDSNDTEYFITQSALWIYLRDTGMVGHSNSVENLRKEVYNSNSDVANAIKSLVSAAENGASQDKSLSLSTSTNTLTFTLSSDGKYYVSNDIKVSSNGNYSVTITNAPRGTVKEDISGGFRVKVPASSATTLTNSVKVSVSASKKIYNSYEYNPSNSKYQIMSYTTSENLSKNVDLSGSINKTQVTISKVDATNGKELPGATLKLTCNNGAYNKEWVSTTKPVVLSDVPEGTCTLSETIAPEGYVKTTETITFKVVAGKVTATQVMKNKPETKTFDVKISKLDIANSEEIKGAKLEVKNEKGTVVCEWTSDGKVHTCSNLIAGTYTLTEITAPDGYEKAESITFVIDKDGKVSQDGKTVDKIIMYDKQTPTIIPDVPNTLSLAKTTPYIVGLGIVVAGSIMLVRLLKKNEQK